MAEQPELGQLPDIPQLARHFSDVAVAIPELARHFSDVAVQIERFSNLPAFIDGDRLIGALTAMEERLTRLQTGMEERLSQEIQRLQAAMDERLAQEIRGLQVAMQAYDTNSTTRLVNNRNVAKTEHTIEPLVAVANGAEIPNFPRTVDDIMHLQAPDADAILRALCIRPRGSLASKRARIKRCCGIIPTL